MLARGGRSVLLVLVGVALSVASLVAMPGTARADEPPKVLLLLDVSGSMNERISSGGTKFAAAKRALKQVAGSLPAGTEVGLRVYGSKIAEPKAQNPKACTDSELVLPIGPLDKSKMNRAVDSFKAVGETPIAYSLGKAVDDLGDSGKRVVVLISDGEETCAKDPCPTAKKLADAGVNLQFNAVGLDVNAKARKQLQCIADAGDGTYYDASRTGDLTEALRKITQRALRPFQVSGIPVKGAAEVASAPPVPAGQYTDVYDRSRTDRFYTINRTPGSTVTASIASITDPKTGQTGVGWRLKLQTADGRACDSDTALESALRAVSVVSGSVTTSARAAQTNTACATDPTLVLGLARLADSNDLKRAPVEIVIAEEPEITNLDQLPEPVGTYNGNGPNVKATKPVRRTVGGSAFSNSAAVRPGSWSDSVAVGETVFYRVQVQPGQTLRATVDAPWPASSSASLNGSASVGVRIYAPLRQPLTRNYNVITQDSRRRVTAESPEVRVRNRELGATRDARFAAVGGEYFVAVEIGSTGLQLRGRVIPVRLNLVVEGKPSGLPEYATTASPSASPTPSASTSESATVGATPGARTEPPSSGGGSPVVPIVVVGVAGLLAIGGALFLARRRGRHSS